jgi:hypothetical protein
MKGWRHRFLSVGLGAVLVSTCLLVASPPQSADAAVTTVDLGLSNFGRILVDPLKSIIFVSSPGSDSIVVTDLSGNIITTITGESGADAMTIVGSTLYVVLRTAGAIDRIDITTLKETSMLVTGLVSPQDLTYAHGLLWTTTGACASWSTQLASVDPSALTPSVTTYSSAFNVNNGLSYCAQFATNHTFNPDFFVAWDWGIGPATLTSFDVSSGSPVQGASKWESILGNLQDVAINPDQTHLITASGAPYEFDEWNVSDRTADGVVYPANPYPTAVDTSAGNLGVMVGGLDGIYANDLYSYPIGHPSTQLAIVDFGGPSDGFNTVPGRGVAISPDGLTSYAITSGTGAQVLLNLVPIPSAPAQGFQVNMSSVSGGVEGASLSAVLAHISGGTAPYSATIAWGDGTTSAGTITAADNNAVSGTHTYSEEGFYTITVSVTDAQNGAVQGTTSVSVVDAALTLTDKNLHEPRRAPFTAQLATFVDADPGGVVSDYTGLINWGDGSFLSCSGTACFTQLQAGGFAISGTHSYPNPGTYTVTVLVTDSGGARSNGITTILVR